MADIKCTKKAIQAYKNFNTHSKQELLEKCPTLSTDIEEIFSKPSKNTGDGIQKIKDPKDNGLLKHQIAYQKCLTGKTISENATFEDLKAIRKDCKNEILTADQRKAKAEKERIAIKKKECLKNSDDPDFKKAIEDVGYTTDILRRMKTKIIKKCAIT